MVEILPRETRFFQFGNSVHFCARHTETGSVCADCPYALMRHGQFAGRASCDLMRSHIAILEKTGEHVDWLSHELRGCPRNLDAACDVSIASRIQMHHQFIRCHVRGAS